MIHLLFFYAIAISAHVFSTHDYEVEQLLIKANNQKFKIFGIKGDTAVSAGAKSTGYHVDQKEINLAFNFLKLDSKNTCLDIGANIGATALEMYAQGCKKVYAFEPIFDKVLEKTISANNLEQSFKVITTGIGRKREMAKFNVDTNCKAGGNKNGVDVQLDLFANILAQNGIDTVDFMKVDIEGAELALLETSLDLFAQKKIKSALVEIHTFIDPKYQEKMAAVVSNLKKIGYKIAKVTRTEVKPISENEHFHHYTFYLFYL